MIIVLVKMLASDARTILLTDAVAGAFMWIKTQRNLTTSLSSTFITRCGMNPSAHAVLNAPIHVSLHDVHVRSFTIGYNQHLLKKKKIAISDLLFICITGIGSHAQKKKMALGI